ncbi:DUF3891 family protein [Tsukamurella soli]|uniref:DUF3891 family protein n=1 Tax=Tsukamurella soli TaxID=644556 RepID=A0ABP8JTP3_9ACTN
MIISRYDGMLLVVLQPDHGVQTGIIARQWGSDDVPELSQHRHATHLAATHHDDGWAVWERHPTLDEATGQPVQFYDVRPREHLAAYRAGIERAAQIDPWAGLLVSMHGAGLYNDRYGTYRLEEIGEQALDPVERRLVDEFLDDMAALQHRLYEEATGHRALRAPHHHRGVMDDYLTLQVWDRISLQFALRHASDGVIGPLPGARRSLRCTAAGRFELALDPYPFVNDRVELPVAARRIADRPYRDPEEFLAALAAAPLIVLECTAVRG